MFPRPRPYAVTVDASPRVYAYLATHTDWVDGEGMRLALTPTESASVYTLATRLDPGYIHAAIQLRLAAVSALHDNERIRMLMLRAIDVGRVGGPAASAAAEPAVLRARVNHQ